MTDRQPLRDYSQRIDEAFESGAVTQGRRLLEEALQASRTDPAYHEFFRGVAAHYLAGDIPMQVRRLEHALTLAPADPFLLRSMGVALSLEGHDEDALAFFDQALQEDPDDSVALRRKGVALSQLGRHDEAIMWLDAALQANPHDSVAMRNLGVSLSRCGRDDEAIKWFDKALQENPNDFAALRQKGVSAANLGRFDDAIRWYDEALAIRPENVATLLNKARTLIDTKDYGRAIAVYDELAQREPRKPFHLLEKAIALTKLGREKSALAAIEQAYAIPNPAEPLRRGKNYWLNRLGLESHVTRTGTGTGTGTRTPPVADAGGEYGSIARVMEKTWEIFQDDILSFRKKIEEAKNSFNAFIGSSSIFARDRVFLIGARKWNSFTPTLPLGDRDDRSVGGGYFLSANGVGTVIDPGFDFLENFNAMGGRLADIQNIVITHAHNDHTADLESILTLFYQRRKQAQLSPSASARLNPGRSRPAVNLYINLGAFQKFSPMLNLRASDHLGEVRVIAPGEEYMIPGSGITMRILPANHDEIFSKTYAVGLHFTLPTTPARHLVFTGDTGLFPAGAELTPGTVAELEIGRQYGFQPGEIDYFIPHLGSIGDNELKSPDNQENLGESFYPNHLGVQGLIRLITQLRPRYAFVSEFGEELKGFIVLLMELINRCVRELGDLNHVPPELMPVIMPMDLYFFCDLGREMLYCAGSESFEPLSETTYRHLDKNNMSQFYYEPKSGAPVSCDPYFAMKKLEYACRTNSGPFADRNQRTRRL
ncbi:MAG: tetratricopeptide repeat protein [Planctomycetes bacterium]|nr:tetratricopeptide repeat protein [Planctomycetota bacterium]